MRETVDTSKVLELNRRFHDEVEADMYDQRMGVSYDEESRARLVGELERVLGEPIAPGKVAVDLGAGTGKLAIILALLGRHERVVAVDISPRMLERAQASAGRLGCRIETQVSDMVTLPFEDGSVDLVVGSAFLHHLPDPVAACREVQRVLRPGGRFVFVGEPSRSGNLIAEGLKSPWVKMVHLWRRVQGRPIHGWEHDHVDVHTFTPGDVRRMAKGFVEVRFVPEGFACNAIEQGFLVLVRRVVGGRAGADRMLLAVRRALIRADRGFFEHVLPQGLLATVKFSGRRPSWG